MGVYRYFFPMFVFIFEMCLFLIVIKGMKEAVNDLKNRQTHRDDEFDTFGRYIATELRSMADSSAAQRVRFKLARCLMDGIEAELIMSLMKA